MEFEYYYIVIIVVVLKIMIWGCVIYFRSQKTRTVRAQRRFVVVDSHTGNRASPFPMPHNATNDRSTIVNYEEPPATSQGPPSYSEVMANPQAAQDKPPSYSQAVEGETGTQPDTRSPIPPHFTPPPDMPEGSRQ